MKRIGILMVVSLLGCSSPDEGNTEKPETKLPSTETKSEKGKDLSDLEKMQGKWLSRAKDDSLKGYRETPVVIDGNKFTAKWYNAGNPMEIQLNSEATPKRFDLIYGNGTSPNRKGIYKFSEDGLIMVVGRKSRPTTFEIAPMSTAATKFLLLRQPD